MSKIYGEGDSQVKALDDVSFSIKQGEFVLIVGSSGSGKSTLLNMIGLLDHPTKGKILIDGIDTTTLNDDKISSFRNKKLGFIFQFSNLLIDLSVLENVLLPLQIARNTKMSTKTITRCIEKLHENEGIQFTLVYDPRKIENFIPHAILTWIEGDLKEILENLNNSFSDSYLQIPFIAKNQIVLFMYSDNIFKMDELTQKIRNIKNIKSVDLFIPKKMSFYIKWIEKAINDFKKSPKLHLTYQTN